MHARYAVEILARPTILALAVSAVTGCTTLGPMPSTTAIPAAPIARPGAEFSLAAVPGYYLSSSVQRSPKGAAISQVSLLFEPDRLLHLPGLFASGRYVGNGDNGGYLEPLLGYRTYLDQPKRVALGAEAFGSAAGGSNKGASFRAARGGAEAELDFRATPASKYFELHLGASASAVVLAASGDYCLDDAGQYGRDCPMPPVTTHASLAGIYPTMAANAGLEFARHLESAFHGGRLTLQAAGGTMPTVFAAAQVGPTAYWAAGASLAIGVGATD